MDLERVIPPTPGPPTLGFLLWETEAGAAHVYLLAESGSPGPDSPLQTQGWPKCKSSPGTKGQESGLGGQGREENREKLGHTTVHCRAGKFWLLEVSEEPETRD